MGETKMSDCNHESFGYFPAVNEAGWKCFDGDHLMPGEPDGYRPDLDRSHTEDKVYGLMDDLHPHNFIYISNGSMGEGVVGVVAARCHETGLYDQISIIQYILENSEKGHAEFWKKISDGIVAGDDPRDRCHCGTLATSYSSNGHFCSEHSANIFEAA